MYPQSAIYHVPGQQPNQSNLNPYQSNNYPHGNTINFPNNNYGPYGPYSHNQANIFSLSL